MPPTPGATSGFGHSATSSIDYQVRIAHGDEDYSMGLSLDVTSPPVGEAKPAPFTAYYPLFSEWADVAHEQESHYDVALPLPPSPTYHDKVVPRTHHRRG